MPPQTRSCTKRRHSEAICSSSSSSTSLDKVLGNGNNEVKRKRKEKMVYEECPICFEKMNSLIGTPNTCNHNFCLQCITNWACHSPTCPIDREKFTYICTKSPSGPCKGVANIQLPDQELNDSDDTDVTSETLSEQEHTTHLEGLVNALTETESDDEDYQPSSSGSRNSHTQTSQISISAQQERARANAARDARAEARNRKREN